MKDRNEGSAGKREAVAQTILRLLISHPEGLDIKEIRTLGSFGEEQQHLDRRLRSLDPLYVIDRIRKGGRTIYRYKGVREGGEWEYEKISKSLRARILTRDGRRCRMCGRTVDDDNVRLHVDHKIPQEWGGKTEDENLWALCSSCNEGKKNYFANFKADLMSQILGHSSVHRRLAEVLRAREDGWVECDLLEFVANFDDYQDDWKKRLRELRYLGLEIESNRKKRGKRTLSLYKVSKWVELPADPSKAARDYETKRAARNKGA